MQAESRSLFLSLKIVRDMEWISMGKVNFLSFWRRLMSWSEISIIGCCIFILIFWRKNTWKGWLSWRNLFRILTCLYNMLQQSFWKPWGDFTIMRWRLSFWILSSRSSQSVLSERILLSDFQAKRKRIFSFWWILSGRIGLIILRFLSIMTNRLLLLVSYPTKLMKR